MKHKIVYGAVINSRGNVLGPVKMVYSKDYKRYVGKDISVSRMGQCHIDGESITFASPNRKETLLWVNGIKAAMKMLSDWCK